MTAISRRLQLLAALTLGLALACDVDTDELATRSSEPPGPGESFGPCIASASCDEGLTCIDLVDGDVCGPPCSDDRICSLVAQPWPVPFGAELVCAAGECRIRCDELADCPYAMLCDETSRTCVWG